MKTSGIIWNWKEQWLRAAELRPAVQKKPKLAFSFRQVFAGLLGLLSCAILNDVAQAKGSMLDPASTQVAAGYNHSCAAMTTGKVMCWGNNAHGQLGDGSTSTSGLPVTVSGLADVVSVAAGGSHSCALTTLGKVWCWGNNGDGQLGNGTTSNSSVPEAISSLDRVVAIAAGTYHTCALTTVGAVRCWGSNLFGELGDGSTSKNSTPVAVKNLTSGVVAISAGANFTCALMATGGVQCWGYNHWGQLGDGTTQDRLTPVPVNGLPTAAASIATGATHACAVTVTGLIDCWGKNDAGQLGNGTISGGTPVPVPGQVKNLLDVISVTAGELHTCAVTKDSSTYCWGDGAFGALGSGGATSQPLPVEVKGKFVAISASAEHTCALTAIGAVYCWGQDTMALNYAPVGVYGLSSPIAALVAGDSHTCALVADTVRCWGNNTDGQLGGTPTNLGVPVGTGLRNVRAIAAGVAHTCALTTGGYVICWGHNANGELGDGSTTSRSNPVGVSGLPPGIVAITAGAHHNCALTLAGAVWCWGYNQDGEVGDGTTANNRLIPYQVSGLGGGGIIVNSVVAGGLHTCALTTAGDVACWGYNDHGQLGDGTATPRSVPTAVGGLPGPVAAIASGYSHTCVRTTASALMCWGATNLGQVGDGTTAMDRLTPTCPLTLCAVGAIDGLWGGSINNHTWAKERNQAAMWGWGNNFFGQLGLGDSGPGTNRTQPVKNPALNGLAPGFTMTAGGDHTCVLEDADLRCMGYNSYGQLGDGTTTQRNSPVPVLAGQSINFSVPTTLTVGSTFTLAATADSGLPVTFDSWTPSTCTVTGNTLKITAAALCGVRVSQVGGTLSAGGSAAAAPQQLRLIQAVSATTTTLTSSVNPSVLSQSVTFTATVVGVAPTGTVTFSDGATVLCSAVALTGAGNSPTATCTTSTLTLGTHPITAAYSGGAGNAPSSSSILSQVVQAAGSGVTLASSLNPSIVGQSVTFTATVTGTAPTGTVTFNDGAAILCNAVALTGTGNTRTATCSSATLTAGTHNMTATYSGDPSNAAATSPVLVQTVQAAGLTPTTTALNLSPNPAMVGQSVTATVTVRPTSGTAVPSGTVTVTVSGGATSCAATLSAGAGSCTLVFAAAGAYTVTASYSGSGTHAASSTTATITVKASTSAATVAAPMLDPRSLGTLAFGLLALAWRFRPRRL